MVCLKCLMDSRHKSHNIKDISKGVSCLNEQLNMKKL